MKRKSLIALTLAIALLFSLILSGCHKQIKADDISAYAGDKIVISGLQKQEFEVAADEIAQLECVTQSASASRSNGETVKVKVTGPLLDTFLAQYGKKQIDFSVIRFTAKDGYSIAIPSDILKQRDIVLAVLDNGRSLTKDDAPLHAVVPGERAMYWTRMIANIDFETGDSSELCKKIILLETALYSLPKQDYEYYGSVDQIVATRDLLGEYAGIQTDVQRLFLVAKDGLQKSETTDNFLNGAIKFTGEDSPKFVSEQLPIGMHIRDIVSFQYGATAFLSIKQLQNMLDEQSCVHLSRVVRQVGGVNAEGYLFTSQDHTTKEFDLTQLGQAYLALDKNENVILYLESKGNIVCSNIISIEAVGAE